MGAEQKSVLMQESGDCSGLWHSFTAGRACIAAAPTVSNNCSTKPRTFLFLLMVEFLIPHSLLKIFLAACLCFIQVAEVPTEL